MFFIFGRAGSSSAFTVGCLLQVLAHSGCGLSATPPHAIWVISSITWFELLKGVSLLKDGKRKDDLYSFLIDYVKPSFNIIPYDDHAAFVNASITQKLIPAGFPTPILNTQIASIAIANNLILVTKNTKDFQIFKDKCNLMLEDWN